MRRFRAAAVALITASTLTLTGCVTGDETEDSKIRGHSITTKDGNEVTCFSFRSGYGGGLSCDW